LLGGDWTAWLTMQSTANSSPPTFPCLQELYQGNFANSAPLDLFNTKYASKFKGLQLNSLRNGTGNF
jgi:hypothetical protein